MAKKSNAVWIAAGIAGGALAVYLLTRKTTASSMVPSRTTTSSATPTGTPSLISQGLSYLSNLLTPGPSIPAAAPAGLVSVQPTDTTAVTSPAAGVNYINPSSAPLISLAPPADTSLAGDGTVATDIYDSFA